MRDADCVSFLQWALPRLGLHWPGFRRVRRQVCKRLARRLKALGLTDLAAYRAVLESDADEWRQLDALCRISVSRFCRDRGVFRLLGDEILPQLADQIRARGGTGLRIWSAGCASGEEPYSLALLWRFDERCSDLALELVATDVDAGLLRRAQRACYRPSSLRELPPRWWRGFEKRGEEWCLRPAYRAPVCLSEQDIRETCPQGGFDLLLCRNLAFTYFVPAMQMAVARRLRLSLAPGGVLLLGAHERLPEPLPGLEPEEPWLYRLSPTASAPLTPSGDASPPR